MYIEHIPVLIDEAMELLNVNEKGTYVDATLGGGGYALRILSKIGPCGTLVCIDQDAEAIENFRNYAKAKNVFLIKENFKNIKRVLRELEIERIDGIIYDLGVSTHQLQKGSRGFSFSHDGPLDMRMDEETGLTAAEFVNDLPEEELRKIFKEFGEEKFSKRIARELAAARVRKKILTTKDLVEVIRKSVPSKFKTGKTHFATRVFQALRIAVNGELENLGKALNDSIELLKPGGRIAVVAYHSLEDRIVKRMFKIKSGKCACDNVMFACTCAKENKLKILTIKPVTPKEEEVRKNPRARSGKLRCAEKI